MMTTPVRKFKKSRFNNGLTLVTEHLDNFRSVSMGIWVKVGSRHENLPISGVSHFLEHMLFKGTAIRSALDIALAIDQVGGEFNAFTTREYTCFHLLILDRDYRLGLEILTDILLHSVFKTLELDRERKVILQEIAMVEETPEELVHDLFFEMVYGHLGLGQPILGTPASVQAMTRQKLKRYFLQHYQPGEVIVSVAGNIEHQEVKKAIQPLLAQQWPGRKSPKSLPAKATGGLVGAAAASQQQVAFLPLAKSADPTWVDNTATGFRWIPRHTEQVHLIWGVPGPSYGSQDRFAIFLLNVFLGGGMSSALFQSIRETHGLAYTLYSSLSPFADAGVFSVYVATGQAQVPLCLQLIESSLERLKDRELSPLELRLIQDNLKGSILLSADSAEARMSSIAKNELFLGRYVSLQDVCEAIDQVTPQDIQRVARLLFATPERRVLVLGPKPARKDLKAWGFSS